MRKHWIYPAFPAPLPRLRGRDAWLLWFVLVLQLCGMVPWPGSPVGVAGSSVMRAATTAPCTAATNSPFALHDLDAGSRAYLAPVVFEGKARSKSEVHRGIYRVTFEVVTPLKGQLTVGSPVRLEFLAVASPGKSDISSTSQQQQVVLATKYNHSISSSSSVTGAVTTLTTGGRKSSRGSQRPTPGTLGRTKTRHELSNQRRSRGGTQAKPCLMGADVRTGRKYLVFATEWGPRNLTATSPPLVATKKLLRDVKASICKKCAGLPTASGLADVTLKSRARLTLRCRATGVPMPSLTWFKDGKEIRPSKRIRIKTKKRRSALRIRCVKEEDSGVYECRPRNVVGHGTPSKSKVTITKDQRPPIHRPANGSTSLWPLIPHPCPIDSFCLNGGTCKYYEAVGELVCNCAEGYKGQRCENKDILNLGRRCVGGVSGTGVVGGGPDSGGGRRCIPGQGQDSEREISGVSVLGLMQAGRRVGPYSSMGKPAGTGASTTAEGWAAVPTQLTWWGWLADEVERLRCEAE